MSKVSDVSVYILENVLRSEAWDSASDAARIKAVSNSERLLKILLPDFYPNEIPTEDLSLQVLWLLKIDDTIERSEQGVNSLNIEGVSIQLNEMERSIAPIILKLKGINPKDPRALIKRRVGSYGLPIVDTNRTGVRRSR